MPDRLLSKVYKARVGASFGDKEAEVLGKYVEDKGLVTQEEILEDARNNIESPFHDRLEWEDGKAAEEWRKAQVKNIMNHISVEIVYQDRGAITLDRAFVFLSNEDKTDNKYNQIESVLDDPDKRGILIKEAYSNIVGWRRRWAQLQEFEPIFKQIDDFSI